MEWSIAIFWHIYLNLNSLGKAEKNEHSTNDLSWKMHIVHCHRSTTKNILDFTKNIKRKHEKREA